MSTDFVSLYSSKAGNGPPLFFPDPEIPAIFNFDQGLAAPESFPNDDLIRLMKLVLDRDGPDVLDYFDPATGYEELVYGYRQLRIRLAERLKRMQGRALGPMGFILTSGSVQGISLAVNGFVDPGDVVLVEAASFPYALRYMSMVGADVRPVPVDHQGMEVEAIPEMLKAIAAEGKRVKMVYCIPTFQTPTNTEMSISRRHQLLDIAKQNGFIIVEDEVYGDLRFAGEDLPP